MISFVKRVCSAAALAAAVSLMSPVALAADAADKLQQRLNQHDTFSADFAQISTAQQGQRVQENNGHMLIAKPNKFRWVSNEPYPQEITGDGTYIWVYDPDLEQVTRKPAQNATGSAPALILNGQIDELREQFEIRVSDDGQLFELEPRDEQNSFKRIRLFFDGELISELMLEDTLGQRTTIVFSNLDTSPQISKDSFVFELPEGADVIVDSEL